MNLGCRLRDRWHGARPRASPVRPPLRDGRAPDPGTSPRETGCASILADWERHEQTLRHTGRKPSGHVESVGVTDHVDDDPVRVADEEAPRAPRLFGQRVDDLVATPASLCIGRINVVNGHADRRVLRR